MRTTHTPGSRLKAEDRESSISSSPGPVSNRLQGIAPRLLIIFAVLTAAAVLSGGCTTVGPDFTRPSAPVAKDWLEKNDPKVKMESADYSQWWTAFDDPTLNSLIEIAHKNNPSLQIAGIRILEARAQLGIAIGNQFPQQQAAVAAYTYTENSGNTPNTKGGGDLRYQTYNYGLSAAWELDFWGKFRRSIESAGASLTGSIADYDNALVSLMGDVATTYIQIRTFEERMQVARDNVAIQKESLRLTEVRFRNGAVTELDVQQARSLLYDTQSQIPTLQQGLSQAQHTLCVLLGMPPSDLSSILLGPQSIPIPPAEVAVGIPAELLMRRPDIRSAELLAAAQCAQIGVARADLFPKITVTGSFGFLSGSSVLTKTGHSGFGELFNWASFNMATGPSIEWPILNYGQITNNVRLQDARFQEFLVSYQNTVLNAAKEVEDSLVGFLQTQDRVNLLAEAVKAAKRAVELSLIQYRDGAVDYSRVLNAQQSLVQETDRLTQSRGDVPINLIALYRALGGGWEVRLGKGFVSEETLQTMKSRTNWGNLLPPRNLPENLEPPPPPKAMELPQRPDW